MDWSQTLWGHCEWHISREAGHEKTVGPVPNLIIVQVTPTFNTEKTVP